MYETKFHGSFIKMPSDKVAQMASECLKNIREAKEKRRQEELDSWRKIMVNRFWHKLLKKPAPTDEEVINWVNDNSWEGFDYWNSLRYAVREAAAGRVLHACKFVSEIYISTEDLEKIS